LLIEVKIGKGSLTLKTYRDLVNLDNREQSSSNDNHPALKKGWQKSNSLNDMQTNTIALLQHKSAN